MSQPPFLARLKGMVIPVDCAQHVWRESLIFLDMLPPLTRAVFLLHVLFGASCEEIERTIGVPAEACSHHLEEARRAVRRHARGGTLPDALPGDGT